ncbi:MAG: outer membrane protein assembly factor BamB family protein [Planctomycetaceae bacterium]
MVRLGRLVHNAGASVRRLRHSGPLLAAVTSVALARAGDLSVCRAADSTESKTPAAAVNAKLTAWPQFRGPDGQGHAGDPGLPLRWGEKQNVAWKTLIPGEGWSSPVIVGDRLWLTTALDSGKSLRAICVDTATGEILHNVEVFQKAQPGRVHTKNGYASPTPVVDGDRVYVHFGANGTACLSASGEIRWTTEVSYYHHHGPGPSPLLIGDKLFLVCDGFAAPFYDKVKRSPESPQFVVALACENGDVAWRKARDGRHSYATPLAIEAGGRAQIVSPGGDRVTAYDPVSGDELWWCRYEGYSLVPRPVFGHGLVIVCSGYDAPQLLAIRPDGKGDVTDSHVAWKLARGAPKTPSPILVDDGLYFVSDEGVAGCVDAKTGNVRWKHRLGGNFSASPILADGRLYFLSEAGQMHVLEPGAKFKKVATNVLEGKTLASPAISGHALFLRSDRFLYRIEEIAAQ